MKKNPISYFYPESLLSDKCPAYFGRLMSLNEDLVFVNVQSIIKPFERQLPFYDLDNENYVGQYLEVLVKSGKYDLFNLIDKKLKKMDYNFLNKFISCYIFEGCSYDGEFCSYLIKECLKSKNPLLQESAINMVSLFKYEDQSLIYPFSNIKLSHPLLQKKLDRALKYNENVC